MSIAKGLARAAKAAKRRNKNKARQGNDLVGNRGEDGSLMTEKDWSNKIREEKQIGDISTMPRDELESLRIELVTSIANNVEYLETKPTARVEWVDELNADELYDDRLRAEDAYQDHLMEETEGFSRQLAEVEREIRRVDTVDPDEALAGSPDADRLVQQLDNNDIKLSDLSKDELARFREQLSASLDETDYLLKTEGWHVISGAVDRDYATFLFDKKYRLIDLLDEVKYRQEELVFDEITKRSTR